MISITKENKIFIECPAKAATGGPERLHQLCYILRNNLNLDAYMYYFPDYIKEPIPKEYVHYNNPFVRNINDSENNIIISPEIVSALEVLSKFKKSKKIVWFLSIDNYFTGRLKKYDFLIKKILIKIFIKLNKNPIHEIKIEEINVKKLSPKNDPFLQDVNFFVTNSYRGIDFLKKLDIESELLSEYISDDFIKEKVNTFEKENFVAYNPTKGLNFTKKIIKKLPNVKFIPIKGMSKNEVIQTLKKAKVYIDFGNHPGKDGLPREAGILMCCVITGKRGSASSNIDVPIMNQYKFEDENKNIKEISKKISECLNNYETKIKDFDSYRNSIKNEKNEFIKQIKNIFVVN